MDITANNKHRFATKWMNTETVNYTAAYTLCLLVLFAVKQLCKVAFGLGAGAAVWIGAGAAARCPLYWRRNLSFPGVWQPFPNRSAAFSFAAPWTLGSTRSCIFSLPRC